MFPFKAFIFLAAASTSFLDGVRGQCLQNAGYLAAFDASSGNFVGAVARNLGGSGIFTLDTSTNVTNYLDVVTFSNTCSDGGPVFIQILSPIDPNAGYVDLVAGVMNCENAAFMGPAPWVAIAAADGFPHGQFPTPGTTRATLQGAYGNLNTFCGESMSWALGSAVGRQVLLPTWKDPNSKLWPNMPVALDKTRNWLLATPNVTAYVSGSGSVVQQVFLSIFIPRP
ncbi:hypothetical protein GGX14DRAFT_573886 [Mycena pura]|uniref:Uncharacterized protein n=1 Tax=Mycena pura TaxID=153505 RepID=A0AAD6Y3Q6_9AGAR|nr:hypothetical protein GGX14DRAFT_573886 [Mycena pura]